MKYTDECGNGSFCFTTCRGPDASTDLEERVLKMIWGTRLGEPPSYLKQTNVLTQIQKFSKNSNAKDLLPTYEYLCEAAHPNFVGNVRFWSHIEHTDATGCELRVLSGENHHEAGLLLVSKVLWSLGWSAACVRSGFETNRGSLLDLLQKLGTDTKASRANVR